MATQPPPLHIFCGYAHEDKALCEQLKTALAVFTRQDAVSIWHDGDLLPGDQWEREIERELNTADIILLLISPAFIDSNYCWSKEMQWAITRSMTGTARVVPILGRPTSGWKTTFLGKLQALPTNVKPITLWKNRDEAFADIAQDLRNVIDWMQPQDRYPVKEYVIELRFPVYANSQEDTQAQDAAKQRAEHWIQDISHIGTFQTMSEDDQQKVWTIANHQHECHISMRWNYIGVHTIGAQRFPLRSASILLTSQHPAFLDQMIEAGKVPYQLLQWTLRDDLNVPMLARLIFEEGERYPSPGSAVQVVDTDQAPLTHHIEYKLPRYTDPLDEHFIRISLTSKGPSHFGDPSLPARVSLIYDDSPLDGFYRAHKLLSIQTLLSRLRRRLSSTEWQQLINGACTPNTSVG
jgi:hypothetical protein